jgi:hypothetical protein
MNETPQQYKQRILGYVEGEEPLVVQAATAERLERLIAGLSTATLCERPDPAKWSVSEILAHLADAEIVGGFRMRFILGSPGAPIVAFDQDQWVASGHYDKRDPRKSVEQFRVLREANLASLEREQWEHYGIHPERGQESNRGHRPHVCRTRHQPPAADRKDPPEPLIRQLAASGERDRNLLQQDERVPQAGFHAGLDDGVARLLGVGLNENG